MSIAAQLCGWDDVFDPPSVFCPALILITLSLGVTGVLLLWDLIKSFRRNILVATEERSVKYVQT